MFSRSFAFNGENPECFGSRPSNGEVSQQPAGRENLLNTRCEVANDQLTAEAMQLPVQRDDFPNDRTGDVLDVAHAERDFSKTELIDESEDFEKIRELLREAEENGGIVVLGDIEKRREEEQAKEAAADTDEAEAEESEKMSPQLEEALNVLVDLVELLS